MTSQYLHSLFTLEGKTAIATGSTGGLGLEMTVALANAGCDIVSIELPNDPRAPLLAEAISSANRKLSVYHCDVADSAALRATFAKIWQDGIVPDVLLNCAGINRRGHVEDLEDEDIDAVFAINLKASFVAAQEVGKRLLELGRKGKIINIASIIAFIANINISPYACTKGGVLQMTKAFSNEWSSKGIQVNCICPG
jgi:2-dehydro-3-deoxy-D-gluconate 5-dehydrogenase